MALLDSEVQRIRFELGYHVLTVNAEPYISYISLFDQVIQPYVQAGASTTSTTTVTAATTPTPTTLTLTSATGFTARDRVVIDVDDRQEIVTTQNLSGASLTVLLTKAHTGTYPVTVEGGEAIVRELLRQITTVKAQMGESLGEGAVRKVDEVEFFASGSSSTFGKLGDQLTWWREQLASALGIMSGWQLRGAGAQRLAVY